MRRPSKALARSGIAAIGTLAILATPIAIGTASADPLLSAGSPLAASGTAPANNTVAVTNAYGTVTTTTPAGNANDVAQLYIFHDSAGSQTINLFLSGTSGTGYFPASALQNDSNVTVADATHATCTATASTPAGNTFCEIDVADTASEALTVSATDTGDTPNSLAIGHVNFNGVHWNECNQTGQNSAANCATQGSTNTPTTTTLTYLEAGAAANKQIEIDVDSGNGQFTATQPAGSAFYATDQVNCTTNASGQCSVQVVDATANDVTVLDAYNLNATPYPSAEALESITFQAASVTPGELDLIDSTLVAPDNQPNGQSAEPGDVIQNTYELRGAPVAAGAGSPVCDPGTAPSKVCSGVPLANTTVTLNVSDGFFTPNCTFPASTDPDSLGVNNYGNCTFNSAPAANAKVGDLKNSGQSITVKTNANGQVLVSLGIAKDSGFDDNGSVTAKVTAGSLVPRADGDWNSQTSSACAAQSVAPRVGGSGNVVDDTNHSGCEAENVWTTNEAPLNGNTAKYVVVPPIKNPSNTFNAAENNFTATDTATANVPDVDRVVFLVHLTDQFGNLTSNLHVQGTPLGATITKTGVGDIFRCTTFSATDACSASDGGGTELSHSVQADGTTTQVLEAIGSYTNNTPGHFSGSVPGQFRYEADAQSPDTANPVNFSPTGLEGANDGTQTDTLSWNPEVSTFGTVVAGTANSPTVAQYNAQSAAATASTDKLTINFYNQLAQPVITFAVKPGHSVRTGTGVTITATVKDQFKNGITNQLVQFVRTGNNESSCVPIQNGGAGIANPVVTNAAGIAGYTFSCNAPGTSTVSVVVTGPGGTQLATGREQVLFTGNVVVKKINEKPTLRVRHHGHHVNLVATTHPTLKHHTVHFYIVKHGVHHLIGSKGTGGNAKAGIGKKLKKGHYTFDCRVVHAGKSVVSRYSTNHHLHIK